jgi:hypothetical protein
VVGECAWSPPHRIIRTFSSTDPALTQVRILSVEVRAHALTCSAVTLLVDIEPIIDAHWEGKAVYSTSLFITRRNHRLILDDLFLLLLRSLIRQIRQRRRIELRMIVLDYSS